MFIFMIGGKFWIGKATNLPLVYKYNIANSEH